MMENISYEENFERVKVDNAFYIGVPQGYDYSHNTDQSLICYELGRPHHFVMYKGKRKCDPCLGKTPTETLQIFPDFCI